MLVYTNHSGTTKQSYKIGKLTITQGEKKPDTSSAGMLFVNTITGDINTRGENGWRSTMMSDAPVLLRSGSTSYPDATVLSTNSPLSFNASTGKLSLSDNPALTGTEGMILPKGTTSQRPSAPRQGETRFNTDTNRVETYGSAWSGLARIRVFNFVRADLSIDTIVFTHNLGNVPVIARIYNNDGKEVSATTTWQNNSASIYFGLSVLSILSGTLTCIIMG